MKNFKRIIAVMLALVLATGSFMCYAAEGEKEYFNYEKVLLLGDSEASGFTDYGDEMSEFTRVDDSYAAYVADYFGAELLPMACPGFRTMELRYMLDDNYRPDDPYLFAKVPRTSREDIIAKSPELRQNIKDSDLIIIGIGGNDWGAYLGWVMADVQLEYALPQEYRDALRGFLQTATFEDDIIGKILELADYLNSVDELMLALPEAMTYAFSTLRENWNYIIEYIYENNPDVTVAAIGMFPTYLKTEEGAPDVVAEPDPVSAVVEDKIIAYGNKHMIDNQEKYGYIFVDTAGTVVEVCHPTKAGHRHIADRILAALPDARFPFTDISIRDAEYKAVEYLYVNNLMKGIDETTFGSDVKITKAELSVVLNKVSESYEVTDSTSEVSLLDLCSAIHKASGKTGLLESLKHFVNKVKIFLTGGAFRTATRAEAAIEIYNIVK